MDNLTIISPNMIISIISERMLSSYAMNMWFRLEPTCSPCRELVFEAVTEVSSDGYFRPLHGPRGPWDLDLGALTVLTRLELRGYEDSERPGKPLQPQTPYDGLRAVPCETCDASNS